MPLHFASRAPSGRIDAGLHAAKILVFDSGLGGLSVLAELRREIPAADIAYVADDAAFPYGDWPEAGLRDHIVDLVGALIAEHRPDFVVIACNTASTLVLPILRARHKVPFVGTVPAIKPAAATTHSGLISVIATPRAIASDYTRQLVEAHAGGVDVTLVGAPKLASIVEVWLAGETVDDEAVRAEIAPCFVERDGKRTDVVVLGCTHYPSSCPSSSALRRGRLSGSTARARSRAGRPNLRKATARARARGSSGLPRASMRTSGCGCGWRNSV